MPVIKPTKIEKKDKNGKEKFISRCMESLKDEKRPQPQKLAMCFQAYKSAKQNKKSKGCSDCEPEWEDLDGNGYYIELQ